jgi:hypothetical protein
MEEVGKNKAEADKEAAIAIQNSEAQIKKAEAEKKCVYRIQQCPEGGCCIRIRATGYQSSIRKESRRRES